MGNTASDAAAAAALANPDTPEETASVNRTGGDMMRVVKGGMMVIMTMMTEGW